MYQNTTQAIDKNPLKMSLSGILIQNLKNGWLTCNQSCGLLLTFCNICFLVQTLVKFFMSEGLTSYVCWTITALKMHGNTLAFESFSML